MRSEDAMMSLRGEPGFNLIIAGSRNLDARRVRAIIREHWKPVIGLMQALPMRILSGGCPTGADRAGEMLAKELTNRKAVVFDADWDRFGKSAGPARNIDMVTVAHGLLLIWDGESRGSRHVLSCMEIRGRPVFEIEVSNKG